MQPTALIQSQMATGNSVTSMKMCSDCRNYDNTTDGSDLFIEMYDLDKDPHQLHNLAKESSPALKAQLHEMAVKQFHCAGASCT